MLSLPFAQRFLLATDPDALTRVLGIVYRTISGHVPRRARLTFATGATGAVTLIQRFGSALNLRFRAWTAARRRAGHMFVVPAVVCRRAYRACWASLGQVFIDLVDGQ